jgi:hypothetical protein
MEDFYAIRSRLSLLGAEHGLFPPIPQVSMRR